VTPPLCRYLSSRARTGLDRTLLPERHREIKQNDSVPIRSQVLLEVLGGRASRDAQHG
jgi:hypothetical protein